MRHGGASDGLMPSNPLGGGGDSGLKTAAPLFTHFRILYIYPYTFVWQSFHDFFIFFSLLVFYRFHGVTLFLSCFKSQRLADSISFVTAGSFLPSLISCYFLYNEMFKNILIHCTLLLFLQCMLLRFHPPSLF